jgi:hypothetical protein
MVIMKVKEEITPKSTTIKVVSLNYICLSSVTTYITTAVIEEMR